MKASIPTPQIGHFTQDDYQHIYEPAEDSFILLDALEEDAIGLRDMQPSLCVEIGSGSGIVTAFLSSILGSASVAYLTTDINPRACQATLRTAQANQVLVDTTRCDLLSPLLPRATGNIDVLIFNPPYVPTEEEERLQTQSKHDIGGAWAGGLNGMTVTNRLLEILPTLLSSNGRFYLVTIEQNDPVGIIARMAPALEGRIVLRRRAGREHLAVLCFVRSSNA